MSHENPTFDHVKTNLHKVKTLEIFEVTEEELDQIERGDGGDIFFNLFIALISISITSFITLLAADINYENRIYIWMVVVLCFIGSLLFFAFWFKDRGSVKRVIENIRARRQIFNSNNGDKASAA